MTIQVRKCQGCKEERPEEEVLCGTCGWDLTQESLCLPGQSEITQEVNSTSTIERQCTNAHPLEPGDEMCFICGASAVEELCNEEDISPKVTNINDWVVLESIETDSTWYEQYIVERFGHRGLLTLYRSDFHRDPSIYDVLNKLPKDCVSELLTFGEWQDRRYEIVDLSSRTNLLNLLPDTPINLDLIRQIISQLGKTLNILKENGLRHGNLSPQNILIKNQQPLELILTGFNFAQLSTFDLDEIIQPTSARYMAPEVIAGGVSISSDWWSLGMMILQLITNNQCFSGINEKAYQIHVVTRGISLPKGIDPDICLLLKGLLARDPDHRWQWPQIQSWLDGKNVEPPSEVNAEEIRSGPTIELQDVFYTCPKMYALAAAEAINWDNAKDLLIRGVVTTWLEHRQTDSKITAGVRLVTSIESISDDFRHALALMWMNPSLPLIFKGNIVNSAWLLQNPIQGYEIISNSLIAHLRQMHREHHLCELHDRAQRARERARILEIEINEESFRMLALASSRGNLERQWSAYRRLYPSSDHSGINSLIERQKITAEELIILLCASVQQYESAAQILDKAVNIALQAEISSFDITSAQKWFEYSRRELYRIIDDHIEHYSRCGIANIDNWADDFRTEKRMGLPKALILLSVPKEKWLEPPRQQYIANLLEYFEKRISSLAQRGPLVRMVIGRSNTRVDLSIIAGKKPSPSSILEHLIDRNEIPMKIDRLAFKEDPQLEPKLRHLVSHAKTYRRETGIDSLYLGFPFLIMQENRPGTNEAKPRIMPILLWPIRIDVEDQDNVSILFDRDREEVRLNPALNGLLSLDEIKKWDEVAKEILGRSTLRVLEVIDAFGTLAEPRERKLCPLPNVDYKIQTGIRQLVCSAILFHAEFIGQAIGEDLREIRVKDVFATGIETALRVKKGSLNYPPLPVVPESDRYFTMESDPSQEKAVFQARHEPGLLIEGPPGTGKSQTIVNIIADCIGRKQSVLVICQKSAALEVLAKRLDAEDLQSRYFYITHINKDRSSVIQALRTQFDNIIQSPEEYGTNQIERRRKELAEKIENLESEIDKHHKAIHQIDEVTGISYRMLLGQLMEIEEGGIKLIDVPALRVHLSNLSQNEISMNEEVCSSLSIKWLESCFEDNPLENLKLFTPDEALINEFNSSLFALIDKENSRDEAFCHTATYFDVEDPRPHQEWIKRHDKLLKNLNWENVISWFSLFSLGDQSEGLKIIDQFVELKNKLDNLKSGHHHYEFSRKLTELPTETIKKWLSLAITATSKVSFFGHLNLFRHIKLSRIQKIVSDFSKTATTEIITEFRDAISLEIQLRPIREAALDLLNLLYKNNNATKPVTYKETYSIVERVLNELHLAKDGIFAINNCPRQEEIESIAKIGLEAYQILVNRYEVAFMQHGYRVQSLEALNRLAPYFSDLYLSELQNNIQINKSNASVLGPLIESLFCLRAYLEFRFRAKDLSSQVLTIFAILRKKQEELKIYPIEQLGNAIKGIIAREFRLASKDRIEQQFPILRLSQNELSRKIEILEKTNEQIRILNRNFLSINMNTQKVQATRNDWENITRLRGPRTRRLREIIEMGTDIGLMQIRPVWLMNPDTASRLFPLKPGMFDVVIFDEASQIPIENALPGLFRAKRVIISGDEHQMPPTNIFKKRVEDDEDNFNDDLDDIASESERMEFEQAWDRREIKDCPDLLALGKTFLPKTMLQIHYRSKYRELITFSNTAFYGGNLNVPVRHPTSVIQNIRPIEVIRVDGIYADQTNRNEAERVVDILAEKWAISKRPSIAVVTFNAKQADLIEDVLAERAKNDHNFSQTLAYERNRYQHGEDMSFFVKNVENIQGDERDLIIFSTTFGRTESGSFRRNFGLLSQTGGERRLNVAITRAREKIILITSLPIEDISDSLSKRQSPKNPRDYLQAYLDYASKLSDGAIAQANISLNRITSENLTMNRTSNFNCDGFIRSVEEFIKALGFNPSSIKENDAFGLDFVIEDPQKNRFGIGIECDAHCHPMLETARAREIWRPKVLRLGIPQVHRVSSYSWYHQKNEEMEKLKRVLEQALNVDFIDNTKSLMGEIES